MRRLENTRRPTRGRTSARIRIAISGCLLGQEVRYDGGHKLNEYITGTLGEIFDFLPLCPEVAIGMGIPRPPIRLVRRGGDIRALGVDDATLDVTEPLANYADRVAAKLGHVSGYILKNNSPSCGMERVKLYSARGMPANKATGIYAGRLMELCPALPFEEEGRLMDPVGRENFIERVFIYHRWQQIRKRLTARALVDFHVRHKFIVLAHDEKIYRALGRLVARAGRGRIADMGDRYIRELMAALKKPATRNRHANVLQHIAGYFKKHIEGPDKAELQDGINRYRRGLAPLIVPVTLLRHYLRRFPDPYLEGQWYLAPHPDELMLRNQI